MTEYVYRAVTVTGRPKRGVIAAETEQEARRLLRDRAILATHLAERKKKLGQGRGKKLDAKGLALMTRHLATLVANGVRIEDALETIAQQNAPRAAPVICAALRARVLEGDALSKAMGQHPTTFDVFYRASVEAGEAAGALGQVLFHLADHLERRAKNRRAIQLALIYPALLAVVSMCIITGLLVFVVPDIVRAFAARGAELPGLTRGLIAVSDLLQRWGGVILLGVVILSVVASAALQRLAIKRLCHRVLAMRPPLKGFIRQIASAQFCSTLALLLSSGVTLTDALACANRTVTNLHIRARLDEVLTQVGEGAALSAAMKRAAIFSPMLIVMVTSGERSGTLATSLTRTAETQTEELSSTIAAFVALAEPLILLLMGGIVMLLVLAILMPIININNLVG